MSPATCLRILALAVAAGTLVFTARMDVPEAPAASVAAFLETAAANSRCLPATLA